MNSLIWAKLIWSIFIFSACGYVVFFKGESGWWFLLAILLINGTAYRSIATKKD